MKFPSKCPHCAKDIADVPTNTHYFERALPTPDIRKRPGVAASIYTCMHCGNPIYIFRGYIINNKTKKTETVHNNIFFCYPLPAVINYPEKVKLLSPKAYEIYNDTYRAKASQMHTLLGAGLRMALEWLIWDYLLKVKSMSEDVIKKMSLKQRVDAMDATFYASICAKIIRLFGNDTVHVMKLHDISVDEAFLAFEELCQQIESELTFSEINSRISN